MTARLLGVLTIFVGAVAIGFNPNRWDVVVADLPRGHGVHLHEIVGMMLIMLGVLALWRSPRSG